MWNSLPHSNVHSGLPSLCSKDQRGSPLSALTFLVTSVKLIAYFGQFLFKCAEESDYIAGLELRGSSKWRFFWMSVEK